ncbi:methyltransferase [Nocardioides sp. GXQ0305]|uniref:methyltransferase n=1 Tax=Nocardioides sp. GXQ0305 TaxID=3423912 RepID=UPI003D7DCCE6
MTQDTTRRAMDAAKDALAAQDWSGARRLLAPLVAENPHGVGAFMLARAELGADRPEVAAPLVAAFRAWRPRHVGARVLSARIHLACGELDRAEADARAAQELEPERPGVVALLETISAARDSSEVDRHLAVIDRGLTATRASGASAEVLHAAAALQRQAPGPGWTKDPRQAKIAYFHHAGDLTAAVRNYDPHLIETSCEFDYITWPKRIQEYVRGRSVLDVGCGFGGYGMGFLVAGAAAYTGLDPAMELDSSRAKNKRIRKWADMGVTPRDITEALPAIRLVQASSEDCTFEEYFDTIALHNVTEHLIRLEEVMAGLARLCRPGSDVVFHHHNFYCWNGHHLPPNQPAQLDDQDPRHQLVYDWRHVNAVDDVADDHYIKTNLNRVRLDELREITERYFDIVRWDEIPSSDATLSRLTPQVLARVRDSVPDITERELSVNAVLGVARLRGGGT